MEMKSVPHVIVASMALAVTACQHHAHRVAEQPLTLAGDTLAVWDNATAVDAFASLPGQRWLLLTEAGLSLVDAAGARLAHQPGKFESLDWRPLGPAALATVIDVASGTVAVFRVDVDGGQLTPWPLAASPAALAEAQCLYHDETENSVQLFLVGADAMVSQLVLAHHGEALYRDVRQFPLPGEADSCAVADATGMLYLVIEDSGVWRVPAAAETDATPSPVALLPPFGAFDSSVEQLFAVADSVWTLGDEGNITHLMAPAQMQRYQLAVAADMPNLRIERCAEAVCLTALESESGALRQQRLLTPGQRAVAQEPHSQEPHSIVAAAETDPMPRFGDAADDPAIYVDARAPENSVILGTDKRGGLELYDLSGRRLQRLEAGRLNNVDVRPLAERPGAALVAASRRDDNSIAFFVLDDRRLHTLNRQPTGLDEVYGLCMYRSATGDYVFINDKDGRYEQYRVSHRQGKVHAELVRAFALPSQPEGCVAHDSSATLYLGEEAVGVWAAGAEPDGAAPRLIIPLDDALVADVEGLAIHDGADGPLLVISSQGNDSYVVHALREGYPRLAHFRVQADYQRGIDGVSETDGLALTAAALPGFPAGLLVLQDGRNRMPDAPQNFKLVDWSALLPVWQR